MGTSLRVLVPEATTNYVLNPALRYDTTGYNAVGSTLTRTLDYARFNIASLKIVTNGAALYEGTFYRASNLSGINEPITASVYLRGAGFVRVRLICNPTGKEWYSKAISLQDDRWQRVEVSGLSMGSDDVRIYVETDKKAQALTFYADGFQLERKPYATSYCDGNQPGCQWNVQDHASISTRNANTRQGGKWVALAGQCRENDDIYVTVLGGLGMPPIMNNIQPWATAPGSYFQNTKVLNRVVTLTFTTKRKKLISSGAPDISPLHKLRQQLIDVVKPDKTGGNEPFLFEYDAGDYPLYVWLRYEAGLEGQWDVRNEWINSFPIRLLAVDPFMAEDNQNVKQLSFKKFIGYSGVGYFTRNVLTGLWSFVNLATYFFQIERIFLGLVGEIYIVGRKAGTLAYSMAKYINGNITWIGEFTGGSIQTGLVSPTGDIYAIGAFTGVNGVAANRIAKYNGTSWSALGTGLDNTALDLYFANNGQLYVGGSFHTAGGVTVNHIARWDGLAWRVVGTPAGLNDSVTTIIGGNDPRTIYCGGAFTGPSAGAGTYGLIAAINIDTNLFSSVGGGFSLPGNVLIRLAVGGDGRLYAGGTFTQDVYGNPILSLAVFNGGKWYQLGDGISPSQYGPDYWAVSALVKDLEGGINISGSFRGIGDKNILGFARWYGGEWNCLDVYGIETGDIQSFFHFITDINGNLYGLPYSSTYIFGSSPNSFINNGTTETKPKFYIKGPGYLRYIENVTTKKKMFFNLSILQNEEIIIDCKKSTLISAGRGDITWALLKGSDFSDFILSPGTNDLLILMTGDVNASMQISYVPQHWSADAVVVPEELQ